MTVHRYFLPANEAFKTNPFTNPWGDSWTLWLLDGETRTLLCHGDYGTWAFSWGPDPQNKLDFRQELFDFENDYIAAKLSTGRDKLVRERPWLEHLKEVTLPRLKTAIKTNILAPFSCPVCGGSPLTPQGGTGAYWIEHACGARSDIKISLEEAFASVWSK